MRLTATTLRAAPGDSLRAVGCLVLVFLLLAVTFVGIGFAIHLLWIVALIFFLAWVAGYAFSRGERRAWRRRGWPGA